MSLKNCCTSEESGSYVKVNVDVTKIVKYCAFAGVLIVGIIFGTRCFRNMLEEDFFDQHKK